jgi:hypothetical protein
MLLFAAIFDFDGSMVVMRSCRATSRALALAFLFAMSGGGMERALCATASVPSLAFLTTCLEFPLLLSRKQNPSNDVVYTR